MTTGWTLKLDSRQALLSGSFLMQMLRSVSNVPLNPHKKHIDLKEVSNKMRFACIFFPNFSWFLISLHRVDYMLFHNSNLSKTEAQIANILAAFIENKGSPDFPSNLFLIRSSSICGIVISWQDHYNLVQGKLTALLLHRKEQAYSPSMLIRTH